MNETDLDHQYVVSIDHGNVELEVGEDLDEALLEYDKICQYCPRNLVEFLDCDCDRHTLLDRFPANPEPLRDPVSLRAELELSYHWHSPEELARLMQPVSSKSEPLKITWQSWIDLGVYCLERLFHLACAAVILLFWFFGAFGLLQFFGRLFSPF
jgi:hypothetical protein